MLLRDFSLCVITYTKKKYFIYCNEKMMKIEQYADNLDQLCNTLVSWAPRFTNNEINDIISLRDALKLDVTRFEQDQQTLNIAIMGQVKAGKSTFLNALLFNGKPILPTAATPKTANLTRISYGEIPALEVEYYSVEDWNSIEQTAQSQDSSDDVKVAKELVSMIESSGVDPYPILQQQQQRIEANNLDDLMEILNQYAGNDGQYTALVKMIRLYLPNDELKGFDVIDTPGMNDPVISRTQKTKEEMARCDVVFFLSRSSQFLDGSDIQLLTEQLPHGGVERIHLVAGQYDSAILDDGYDHESLADCEQNIQTILQERAVKELGQLAEDKKNKGSNHLAELLTDLVHPVVSSTFAYGYANWPKEQWDRSMQHSHQQLVNLADSTWSSEFTQQDWQRIANFETLRQLYQQAREEKVKILESKKQNLLSNCQEKLNDLLNHLNDVIQQRTHQLQKQDLAQLQRIQNQLSKHITVISSRLEKHIAKELKEVSKLRAQISKDLEKGIKQHNRLSTYTGTETHQESYEVSTSKWYKPWTWGDTETCYRNYTTNYQYLSSSDAVEQVTQYVQTCKVDIQYQFNQLINLDKLKLDLRISLTDALNQAQNDFDANQFKNILDSVIRQLKLPSLNLNIANPNQMISKHFKGKVRSQDDIQALKNSLSHALQQVFQLLKEQFNQSSLIVEQNLQSVHQQLESKLTDGLAAELDQIKQDFESKQEALQQYQQLQQLILPHITNTKVA